MATTPAATSRIRGVAAPTPQRPYSSTNLAANARAVVALGDRQSASRPQRPPGSAHTDENAKASVQEFLLARVTPNEKSRHLGTVEPAAQLAL
jgi:hypothetical protein